MSKLFLEHYSGQSTDELIALKDTYRIDSLILAVEAGLANKPNAELTVPERVVLAVEAMEREVNNGGYNQFFFNSSRDHASFLVHALQLIGCHKVAVISAEAISTLSLPEEYDGDMVQDAVMALSEAGEEFLKACDSRYYANDEFIEDKLFAYIERERALIRIP
jgi:hypothetical protein